MIGINAKVDLGKLTKNLQKFVDEIDNFGRPIKQSLQVLRDEQRENFDKQGALYQGGGFVRSGGAFANAGRATTRGRSWEPLKESTQKDRARQGYRPKRPILVRTGKLKQGFKVTKIGKKEAEIKNTVSYAKYHQLGTRHMSARRIIGTTNKSKAAIKLIFLKYIQGSLKRFK